MDDDPWAEYARLQSMLGSTANTHKAAGIEAAMNEVLNKIERGETFNRQQVNNLVVNRSSKERRHRAIAAAELAYLVPRCAETISGDNRLVMANCASICGPRDFTLLVSMAMGYTYRDIAQLTGANQNTLKIRAFRARQKISHLAS